MTNSLIYTLPSNTPNPNNTLSQYVVQLPSSVTLDKSWKVAMLEISYTKSWFNIHKDHIITVVDDEGGVYHCPEKLGAGMYETEQSLIDAIQSCVRSLKISEFMRRRQTLSGMHLRDNSIPDLSKYDIIKPPSISLNCHNHTTSIVPGERRDKAQLFLSFDKELENILGISRDHFEYDYDLDSANEVAAVGLIPKSINGVGGSFRSYDLKAGIHTLMVYCNLVKPVLVGNTYANLLRSVHIPHNTPFGHQVNIQFQKPYYLPLSTTEFEQIELEIRDDNNKLIPFQWGRTTITLELTNDA